MFEQLGNILDKFSTSQPDILFLLGLILFGGTIGGRLFQKLRVPQVVGYISIGIFVGESGLKLISHDTIIALQPFSYFALGLIGFMIGGELKKDVLVKYGKQFISILLFEGITAFVAVALLVGITGIFLFKDWRLAWSLGLLLGAIASATAPAATTSVLREYKTRGPLTRIILGIVAMDDGLALLLFALAASVAGSLSGKLHEGALRIFIHPLYEIGVSIAIGVLAGLTLTRLFNRYSEKDRLLVFSVGGVLFVSGLALAIHVDMLLSVMALGVIVVNFIPQRRAEEIFKIVDSFTPPIYVLFFVLVGAKLNISYMTLPVILLALVYLFARSAGKMLGAGFGAKISGAPKAIQKYLPLSLFSQAGVAIGLSILASNYFPDGIGNMVVVVVTTTVLVLEVVGPFFVKIAVTRAKEVGLNITEEDFMRETKVKEVMDKEPPLIFEDSHLDMILSLFSRSDNLYYPVIDKEKKLTGIIGVESIKNTFMEAEFKDLLLAADLKDPVTAAISEDVTLLEVEELLDKHNLECVPVVTDKDILAGFVERRVLNKLIPTKIMELQKRADSLG